MPAPLESAAWSGPPWALYTAAGQGREGWDLPVGPPHSGTGDGWAWARDPLRRRLPSAPCSPSSELLPSAPSLPRSAAGSASAPADPVSSSGPGSGHSGPSPASPARPAMPPGPGSSPVAAGRRAECGCPGRRGPKGRPPGHRPHQLQLAVCLPLGQLPRQLHGFQALLQVGGQLPRPARLQAPLRVPGGGADTDGPSAGAGSRTTQETPGSTDRSREGPTGTGATCPGACSGLRGGRGEGVQTPTGPSARP